MILEILFGIAMMTILALCLLLLYIRSENKKFRVSNYTIKNEKIPDSFDGCKIAFLSDLHGYEYGENNIRLIRAIEEQSPDYILIGGDMIVKGPEFDGQVALRLVEALSKKYPVYYANGNHELRVSELQETKDSSYVEYVTALKKCGVQYLVNETCLLKRGNDYIALSGLNLEEYFYSKFKLLSLPKDKLTHCLGKKKEELFTILLAHNPVYFNNYKEWGPDLVLSGHVHGGMIALPKIGGVISTQGWLFPKYDFGEFKNGKSTMILSRGLGNHTIDVRINNRAEVVMIELKKE